MSAFTDEERIRDRIERWGCTSKRALEKRLSGDKAFAAMLADDPTGSKSMAAAKAIEANRKSKEDAESRKCAKEAAAAAADARVRKMFGGLPWRAPSHPDEPDWAELGIPVDECGYPLGIGDD